MEQGVEIEMHEWGVSVDLISCEDMVLSEKRKVPFVKLYLQAFLVCNVSVLTVQQVALAVDEICA